MSFSSSNLALFRPNYGRLQPQLRRQQENDGVGFKFEPRKVMTEARDAAKMTRGLADIVDTQGNDFLDLMSTFSSEGKSLSYLPNSRTTIQMNGTPDFATFHKGRILNSDNATQSHSIFVKLLPSPSGIFKLALSLPEERSFLKPLLVPLLFFFPHLSFFRKP